jgi:hypothetical protein
MLRRRPRLTPDEVLQSRPVRNQAVESERVDGGGIRLTLGLRPVWWARLVAVVLPVPRKRQVELDSVGEEVWDLCDGEHTLRDIIRIISQRHKLTRAEAEWSLRTYLRDLGKRGLVGFAIQKSEASKGEASHGRRD